MAHIRFIYNTVTKPVNEMCMLCEEPITEKYYVRDYETKLLFHNQLCWHFFSTEYQKIKEQTYATMEKPQEDVYR